MEETSQINIEELKFLMQGYTFYIKVFDEQGKYKLAKLELAFRQYPAYIVLESALYPRNQVIDILNVDSFEDAIAEFIQKNYHLKGYILLTPWGTAYRIRVDQV